MTALSAALEALEDGRSVVPLHTPVAGGCTCVKGAACDSVGKHTRVAWRAYQERRPAEGEVREWFHRWPNANLGIITGVVSGLAVVDVDVRNGGLDTLAELDAHGAEMPDDNPLVITGSGGLHHYFALDQALAKAAPFAGIEVQADGALVVAPPSLHRLGHYRWARHPRTARMHPVPEWLRWACERTTPAGRSAGAPPRPITDAGQDDVLGALAARQLYLRNHPRRGFHRVRCPWAELHSNHDSEAVVMEPGASPAPGWGFKCQHAHCQDRHIGDLLDVLGVARRGAAA